MEREAAGDEATVPEGIVVCPYVPERHHAAVPAVVAEAFSGLRWSADWEDFPEFDPHGLLVAVTAGTGVPVGFVIGFRRRDTGYVSVVAVLPGHQRRGVGRALLGAGIAYLRGLGLERVQVDAFTYSAAVRAAANALSLGRAPVWLPIVALAMLARFLGTSPWVTEPVPRLRGGDEAQVVRSWASP